MDFTKANNLLEMYFAGETSLNEEKWLQDYFSKEENAQPEQEYAGELFRYFREEATLEYEEADTQASRFTKATILKISAIAAAFLLLAGTLFFLQKPDEPVAYAYINGVAVTDHELAIDETQKALSLITEKLNKSTADLTYLSKFTDIEKKFTKNQ